MRLATQPLRKFSHNSGGKIRTEFFNTQLDARRNCIPLAPGLLRRDPQPLSQPLCLCGIGLAALIARHRRVATK